MNILFRKEAVFLEPIETEERGGVAGPEEITSLLTDMIRDPATKTTDCLKAVEMLVKYTGMFREREEEIPVLRVELSSDVRELAE